LWDILFCIELMILRWMMWSLCICSSLGP
jgi:hypothetical protein